MIWRTWWQNLFLRVLAGKLKRQHPASTHCRMFSFEKSRSWKLPNLIFPNWWRYVYHAGFLFSFSFMFLCVIRFYVLLWFMNMRRWVCYLAMINGFLKFFCSVVTRFMAEKRTSVWRWTDQLKKQRLRERPKLSEYEASCALLSHHLLYF